MPRDYDYLRTEDTDGELKHKRTRDPTFRDVDAESVTTEENVTEQSTVLKHGLDGTVKRKDVIFGDGIQTQGGYAYGGDSGYFTIYDLTRDEVVFESDTLVNDFGWWFGLHNEVAIVPNRDNTVQTIDISDPANPSVIDSTDISFKSSWGDFLTPDSNRNIFYATEDSGTRIAIVDYSNPDNIRQVDTKDVFSGGLGSYIGFDILPGGYLLAKGYLGEAFEILDISDPVNPTSVYRDGTQEHAGIGGDFVDYPYAYIPYNSGAGTVQSTLLKVYDISNPENPSLANTISVPELDRDYERYGVQSLIANNGTVYKRDALFNPREEVVYVLNFDGSEVVSRKYLRLDTPDSAFASYGFAVSQEKVLVGYQNGDGDPTKDQTDVITIPKQYALNFGFGRAEVGDLEVDDLFARSQHAIHMHAGASHFLRSYIVEGTVEKQYQQTNGSLLTGNTTISKWGQYVDVDTSESAVTITLASSMLNDVTVDNSVWVVIQDVAGNAGTNQIDVTTEGTETIDGSATVSITSDYDEVKARSPDGKDWVTY